MQSEKKGGTKTVLTIEITKSSIMKTAKGVGMGMDERFVRKQYREKIDGSMSKPGRQVVAGSIYSGTIFSVENGKVSKIFIVGAAY